MQIGDVVPIETEESITYLRIVSLKYTRDTTYMKRVLDIQDAEVAERVLPTEIEVSELLFNSQPGYLVCTDALKSVKLQDPSFLVCPPATLPRFSMSHLGKLDTIMEPYFVRALEKVQSFLADRDSGLPSVLCGQPGSGRTHLLKYMADSLGYGFQTIDCLAHFNMTKLQTLLTKDLPSTCRLSSVIELVNFHRYGLLLEGGQQ